MPQLRIQYGVRKWERPRGHLFFACNFDRQRTGRLFQCAPKRPQRPTNRQNLTGLASSSLILDRVPLYTVHQNHSSNHSSLLHSAVVDTTLCLNRGIDTAQKPQEHNTTAPPDQPRSLSAYNNQPAHCPPGGRHIITQPAVCSVFCILHFLTHATLPVIFVLLLTSSPPQFEILHRCQQVDDTWCTTKCTLLSRPSRIVPSRAILWTL